MGGLKTGITGLLFSVVLSGMLLTDVIVLSFWQHERVMLRYQTLFAMLDGLVAVKSPRAVVMPPELPLHGYQKDSKVLFCLIPDSEAFVPGEAQSALCAAARSSRDASCSGPCRWNFRFADAVPGPASTWLAAGIASSKGQDTGALLVALTRKPGFFQLLRSSQNYVLAYILLNALILSIMAFFRLQRRLFTPLERLRQQADSFRIVEFPLFLQEYQHLGLIGELNLSLNDMIQRIKRDQESLQQMVVNLEENNRVLRENQAAMIRTEKLAATGRLAAGLAHEIGNPLGVVQGYLELLQITDCSPDERQQYCANALRETKRMDTLITTLLQTARSSPIAGERLDMHRLLGDYVEALRPQAVFKGIALRLRLEAEQPEVLASEDSIRQVVLNALFNAADAIRASGAAKGLIELSSQQVKRDGQTWFELCVSDSGCGLAPEHASKIFDPFFSTKAPGAGTGLGLSVSLTLVEAMGGSMRAQNNEEGGMGLYILLPQDQRKTDMKDVPQ